MGVLLCSASALTLSADFSERIASEQRSAEEGLGRDSLRLLKREAGPGAEKMVAVLLERFRGLPGGVQTSDRFKREVTEKHTSLVSDDGWFLQVDGDGTRVRYRNYGDPALADKQGLPLEERFSQKELESMGRDFVAGYLQDLVRLGRNETLMPYFTEFEITGGGPADKSEWMLPERVQTSTVVFSRTLDGLPVVGPGSKIAVIFANDGEPVGFDYDWASYRETGEVQAVLPVDEIRRRGAKFSPFETGDRDVQELHFDCGYVDFGARKRDPEALVQGGCMRHVVKKWIVDEKEHARDPRSGHALEASLDFFPAGDEMWPDATWMQAMRPDASDEKAPGGLNPTIKY
jgi:hypothetical protein